MQYYWHTTTIGRLSSILQNGLLSVNMAQKMRVKGYRRNLKSSWNKNYISLMTSDFQGKVTAPRVALLVDPKAIKAVKPKDIGAKDILNRPLRKEVLVKDSIPPTVFRGIVIGDVGWSFRLEKKVKSRPLSLNHVLKKINKVFSFGSLPIYFKDHRIWPQ